MNDLGILGKQVLIMLAYSFLCLGLVSFGGLGSILLILVLFAHTVTLLAKGFEAERGSVDKQQYFLAAAFVPLVGSSMCFAVMFWI
jgi:hypothetical protein